MKSPQNALHLGLGPFVLGLTQVPEVSRDIPSITGTVLVGQTLTGHVGDWSGNPTFTYRWLRDGVAIVGATAATYELVADDAGTEISFEVTGTTNAGEAVAVSQTVSLIPTNLTAPIITSVTIGDVQPITTAIPGEDIATTNGTWGNVPVSFAYQWRRNGAAIEGATTNAYNVLFTDEGMTITVTVTATNAVGSTSVTSDPVVITPS
jgi:Flp pilus assembly secretin CpaC